MFDSKFRRIGFATLFLAASVAGAAAQQRTIEDRFSQLFGRQSAPPADIGDDDAPPPYRPDNNSSIRIDRLENQLRSMTGQIEQLQFTVRKLEEQLGRQRSGEVSPQSLAPAVAPPVVASATSQTLPSSTGSIDTPRALRRGDAFDPTMRPNAPGAPRQIGTLPGTGIASTPVATSTRLPGGPIDDGAPMDLSGGRLASNGSVIEPASRGSIVGTTLPPPSSGGVAPSPLPSAMPSPGMSSPGMSSTGMSSPGVSSPGVPSAALPPAIPGGPVTTPGGTILASREPFSPKEEYDLANGYLKGGQYEAAEKGYAAFLSKNPKNRLVADAVFNLGESYFLRGRHREAAEQYLKISTTYSNSSRAPEAMLRLGQSLVALGAKEQACASYGEIGRKYPNASPTVKAAAEREAKKSAC